MMMMQVYGECCPWGVDGSRARWDANSYLIYRHAYCYSRRTLKVSSSQHHVAFSPSTIEGIGLSV